ncbi:uncharacterized protein LOC119265435 [Pygocentrus nattereri]|uniref:uncharacterized protein LOC119265435 n=1 Tax=Pygocentrus nattereri TaxID=42514 RepID=UPI001890D467|nr:uncharacterized protein LOC119265435 [Pygocentrus nattereri]
MIDHFSGSGSSILTTTFTQKLNNATGKAVGNLVARHKTQSFFDNQQHHYDLKSAKERKDESLSERKRNETESYANKITDEQHQATALELHVLTKSNLLEGKGICVTVVDSKGKLLSEETYTGSNPAAGTITLRLTKTPQNPQSERGKWEKFKSRIKGEMTPHSGHFDIVRSDASTLAVNSENQNCLFHAVIQATTNAPDHVVKEKAQELRSKVSKEIRSKPGKYVNAVKIQNMFNKTSSCNKFKIEGGVTEDDERNYKEYTENKMPQEIINEYKLGEVEEYEGLINMKKPTPRMVEADHIPPKSVLRDLCKLIDKKDTSVTSLKENKEFCEQVMKMKNDQNGKNQTCMNALYYDHRRALTTGSSTESNACRDLLKETFKSGNVVEGLKLSLMTAHPEVSDNIRSELGINRNFQTFEAGLTQNQRSQYYKDGYMKLAEAYSSKNIIDQNQKTELMGWIEQDRFLTDESLKNKMKAMITKRSRDP